MPLPSPRRAEEYARKAAELVLRQTGAAPEMRAARRLAAQAPTVAATGPRILVLTPRNWAAHVQIEAMLAQALRLRGAEVSFLTCGGGLEICDRSNTYEAPPMPCGTCTRYVEASIDAHGFPRSSLRQGWEAEDPLPWPALDEVPVRELLDVEDDGLPIGRLVDIPLKWFLCAASLDDEPLAGGTGRAFLRSARRIARGVERALDGVRPDTVLLLSGLFVFEAVAWAACRKRGIDVVTYERAFRTDTLVFSRRVPAGFYDLTDQWGLEDRPLSEEEEDELYAYLATRRRGDAADQYWSFDRSGRADGPAGSGRLAVLFTNLTWDTAVIGRNRAFPDIRPWLDRVIAEFVARPSHRLVIRVHPSEVRLPMKQTRDSLERYIAERHPDLPANIEVVGARHPTDTYGLIDSCDIGLVYTSTTGLELALAGKPVVVAGDVHYRDKGFTVDLADAGGLSRALDVGLEDPAALHADVDAARRYAHFFWFRGPVKAPFVTEPLPGLARLTTTDLADLRPGTSPEVDRICDLILKGAG